MEASNSPWLYGKGIGYFSPMVDNLLSAFDDGFCRSDSNERALFHKFSASSIFAKEPEEILVLLSPAIYYWFTINDFLPDQYKRDSYILEELSHALFVDDSSDGCEHKLEAIEDAITQYRNDTILWGGYRSKEAVDMLIGNFILNNKGLFASKSYQQLLEAETNQIKELINTYFVCANGYDPLNDFIFMLQCVGYDIDNLFDSDDLEDGDGEDNDCDQKEIEILLRLQKAGFILLDDDLDLDCEIILTPGLSRSLGRLIPFLQQCYRDG